MSSPSISPIPQSAKLPLANSQRVLNSFKETCIRNQEFRTAIESSTKGLQAIYNRLRIWGTALEAAARLRLDLPNWDAARNRIVFEGFRAQRLG